MRLDFNVLWVDDQPDRIQAQITRIAHHMKEQGFNFNPTLCKSMEQVEERLAADVFVDEVDLILVDWDLGEDVKGQDVIATIREKIQYKDVVFYSAQTQPDELRRLATQSSVEGVYCAARDGLVEEVVGVFDSLVKKVLDLDHTRGIVMGATSDIDHMVNECLTLIHAGLSDENKKKMLADAIKHIGERIKDLSERAAKLENAKDMVEVFEAHILFTSYDRLRFLSRALKDGDFANDGARAAVNDYMQRVVPDRNMLGHVVLVPEGRPQAVVDAAGKHVSIDQMRELRRLILDLRAEFRGLIGLLKGA